MDLWIRTQDRKQIISVNSRLFVFDAKDLYLNKHLFAVGIGLDKFAGDVLRLGVYESEERALEVLNDINEIKFYKYMANLDLKSFSTVIAKKYSVEQQIFLFKQMNTYEMPKE